MLDVPVGKIDQGSKFNVRLKITNTGNTVKKLSNFYVEDYSADNIPELSGELQAGESKIISLSYTAAKSWGDETLQEDEYEITLRKQKNDDKVASVGFVITLSGKGKPIEITFKPLFDVNRMEAGGGNNPFEISITNPSDKTIRNMQMYIELNSYKGDEDEYYEDEEGSITEDGWEIDSGSSGASSHGGPFAYGRIDGVDYGYPPGQEETDIWTYVTVAPNSTYRMTGTIPILPEYAGLPKNPSKGDEVVLTIWVHSNDYLMDANEGWAVGENPIYVKTVPGHTHKWNTGTITTKPTCAKAGVKTYKCTHTGCTQTKTESVAKLPHSYKSTVTKSTCAKQGNTRYTCTGCGHSYSKALPLLSHSYTTVITKATTSKRNGSIVKKCRACGKVASKSTIYYPKTVKLSTTSYTYNGKTKKPSVKVIGSNGKTISKANYKVSYSSGRKNVGRYKAKVTFKGNYSGSISKTFDIKPKSTSVSKVSTGKKKAVVRWKKQTKQTTGYQIQYSTDKKFRKGNKTVTIKKNKTTSKTIKKLKSKKKYYVRVRTYKKAKYGRKYINEYSSWSKVKSVRVK